MALELISHEEYEANRKRDRQDLSNSLLPYVDLHGSDLHGADLRDADLHGADLRDADLRDADLTGADLTGAVYDEKTKWPAGVWSRNEANAICLLLAQKVVENDSLRAEIRALKGIV